MTNKVKYAKNRNYRDFKFEEEEPTPTKIPLLLKKKKSLWQRILDIFKDK